MEDRKKSRDHGWPIVLIDESGSMLQPLVRCTYSWDRHDRYSVIAGITMSPIRRRLGLYFRVHSQNIDLERVGEFLTWMHRLLRGKFILVLDRYSAHRKAVRLLQEAHPDWFEVEWLPAYAPELNPVEMVWNHSKDTDLANFIPEDGHDLLAGGHGHTGSTDPILLPICQKFAPQGEVPGVLAGENPVSFTCVQFEGPGVRAEVTVILEGGPIK